MCSRLPSMVSAMDAVFSYLTRDLKGLVSEATSGPFVDPTQDAKDMASELSGAWTRVHDLIAKLEQLSGDSQNLRGETRSAQQEDVSFTLKVSL